MVAERRHATLEDLDRTPDDGRRYELIDGELVVAAAPNWKHGATLLALYDEFRAWSREGGGGDLQVAPLDVVLSEGQVFQPDLLWLPEENPARLVGSRLHGAPDVAVEVVSPSSRGHDWLVKGMRYAAAGVREYWVVDPDLRTMTVHTLEAGLYAVRPADPDGTVTSAAMAGLRVAPAALFDAVEASVRRRSGGD
jgi:Uma2 family endonuclease